MRRLKLLILIFLCVFFFACSNKEENEDITNTVNKSGAVESAVTVLPLDSMHNILITTHRVWVRGNVYKTVEYRDTLPALGTEMTTAENADGDTKTVAVNKEYEIYITVK